MKKRIYTKSQLSAAKSGCPTFNTPLTQQRAADVLLEAKYAWDSLSEFRKEGIRNRKYTYGQQWDDIVKDPATGKGIKEADYIRSQGKVPLKNNMIRQLVKSVIGQFGNNPTEPVCVASDRDEQKLGEMMSIIMKYIYSLNRLFDVDKRTLESFLITGFACSKIRYGYESGIDQMDTFVYDVNYRNFFFDNNMRDYRYWDCLLVGDFYDMTISDVISSFSNGNRERARYIRDIYQSATTDNIRSYYSNLDATHKDNMDFFNAAEPGLCRVIEVWRKESKERYRCHDTLRGKWYKIDIEELEEVIATNEERMKQASEHNIPLFEVPLIEYEYYVDRYWYVRYMSPFGDVLMEHETPFWHGSHPYVFTLYPFIDGEVHSFVSDVIDQQRYINRLITMIDFIMGASAKGVLLLPEDQIPDNMTVEQVAEEWTRYNGVILYKPKPGVQPPSQISANSTNIGAFDMLNLQMRLIEEVSGVHGAMQGKTAGNGKAASLYAQEAQNASLNLIDVLSSFNTYREDRDTKVMQVAQQFYKDRRYINIAGGNYSEEARNIDPSKVRDVKFDLTIKESITTPAYRTIANDFLMQLFTAGQISVKDLLENGDFPFADRLLQSISKREDEMAQAQVAQGSVVPQDIAQDVQAQSNPLLNQMASR